jgi:hypothetical protein
VNVDYGIIAIFFEEINNPMKEKMKRQPMKKGLMCLVLQDLIFLT